MGGQGAGYTDRHVAFRIFAHTVAYEVFGAVPYKTGGATYLERMTAGADNLINHQNGADGGVPTPRVDGALWKLGSQQDDGLPTAFVASAWLSPIVVDAMVRVYGATERADVAAFIRRMGTFIKAGSKVESPDQEYGASVPLTKVDSVTLIDGSTYAADRERVGAHGVPGCSVAKVQLGAQAVGQPLVVSPPLSRLRLFSASGSIVRRRGFSGRFSRTRLTPGFALVYFGFWKSRFGGRSPVEWRSSLKGVGGNKRRQLVGCFGLDGALQCASIGGYQPVRLPHTEPGPERAVAPVVSPCSVRVPADSSTIQLAMAASPSPGVVCVDPGTYAKDVILRDGVDLRATGPGVTGDSHRRLNRVRAWNADRAPTT